MGDTEAAGQPAPDEEQPAEASGDAQTTPPEEDPAQAAGDPGIQPDNKFQA